MENLVVNRNKKNFRNFTLLYSINLKLSLKNIGSIISGLVFSLVTIIFFITEYSNIIDKSNISSYTSLKYLTFLFGGATLIFHIVLNSLYLFKRQVKDGISSIELRAGYKTWKSYLIRVLITFTVACIYITIPLLFAIILNLANLSDSTFFFNLHYSQIFFFYFLAFFSTIVLSLMMVVFKTSLATLFSMIFMFTVVLAPMFASFKFIMSSSDFSNWKTNIKMLGAQDFYNTFKSDNELFDDDENEGQSKSLNGIHKYLNQSLQPLNKYENIEENSESKFNYKIIPDQKFFPAWNSKKYLNQNEFTSQENFNYEKATHILLKNIGFGQVYYNFNVFDDNTHEQKYLLEKTPIWKIIEKINRTALENSEKLIAQNENEIPSIFVKKTYSYVNNEVNSKDINIENFSTQMSNILPEYSSMFSFIQTFYNKNKTAILADNKNPYSSSNSFYNDIFDFALVNTRNKDYRKTLNFFSWKKVFESNNKKSYQNVTDDFCKLTVSNNSDGEPLKLCINQEVQKQNDEMAKVYKKFPELTIINALIINLWKEAMEFDVVRPSGWYSSNSSIDDGLYLYFNVAKKSNTLTTDISRHFAAMSTGLFSSRLLNDSYNSSGTIFYQGQFLNIKNIFDFENFSSENKEQGKAMKPIYEKLKIKTSTSFIIPLAYFIYILIITPLGYVGYLAFNKKAKL
ncbi:ABC transporter permease [Spiroplasma cantharicola]|uniref:Uncharacterized protein n=1 Tax=Spiroplasma cantharicola TaxID=362837 RepID=A0A0M5KLF6_9MOLU|nr:ABC transporter permease [Spiroplasma cantharicola]ALD66013.1 hypothetical protein SCANT_v1c01030 [Spiroplasma cantharicola]